MIVLSIFISGELSGVDKTRYTEIVDSLENLPAPIQIETTGEKNTVVNGVKTHLTYVAEYTIVGRVVTTRYYGYRPIYLRDIYFPNVYFGYLVVPMDVGIVWGRLSKKDFEPKIGATIEGDMPKDRAARVYITDPYMRMLNGPNGKIRIRGDADNDWSHTHLIPSDGNINKLIKRIEVGDYVKLEGYLVNVDYGAGGMNTSTSRIDKGDGACETMYVTKVTWLKTR